MRIKHIVGNTAKCGSCKYYEKSYDVNLVRGDGWCNCKMAHKVNGRLVKGDKFSTDSGDNGCIEYVNADTGVSRFQISTKIFKGWITEPVPEDVEPVLVKVNGHHGDREYHGALSKAIYSPITGFVLSDESGWSDYEVTVWQRMPEKEE